ncbi:hypothetical protein LCGC14_1995690, partial [marine sediment metagenome]
TINNPFPLREGIMLRPANHEGIMTFSIGLGPEDAFLMGQECVLSLSFDASYNEFDLTEQGRTAEIILLDLRLTENPSSNNPNELWSIFNDQLIDASGVSINADSNAITGNNTGVLVLGDEANKYGVEVEYIFEAGTLTYILDSKSELLTLLNLVDITGVALYGTKGGIDYTFDKVGTGGNNDWDDSTELSSIIFSATNLPDDDTEFTVVYKFDFDFNNQPGSEEYYGKVILDPSLGTIQSSIELYFDDGILEDSEDSKSPMFVEYKDVFTASGQTYPLSYTVSSPTLSDFIIYNYDELNALVAAQTLTWLIIGDYLELDFHGTPISDFTVEYGVKSQYNLGYGFQKQDQTYSDSVRLMYNDPTRNSNPILNSIGAKESIILEDPSLYINLDDSGSETVLELYSLPLLYAPEVNFTFILDEISLNQIETATEFNTLKIEFFFAMEGGYSYIYETKEILLDYTNDILPYLEADDSYVIHYNKDLQGLYDSSSGDNFNIYISISQEGVGLDYLPYIILEKFDYITDEHLAEMYDRMPLDAQGELDVRSVLQTPHYFQIFSKPFKQGVYQMYTPFDLLEGSEVTIGEDLPKSSLVALNIDAQQNYAFDYLGSSETIPVTSDEFYMIENLALYTDAYNLDEVFIQEGFLSLYYGSGTDVVGERDYSKRFYMEHEVGPISPPDYWSEIDGGVATTWVSAFTFSNSFLTTDEIDVSGTAFYHQLFKLYSADIISQTDMNTLFVDTGIQNIQ